MGAASPGGGGSSVARASRMCWAASRSRAGALAWEIQGGCRGDGQPPLPCEVVEEVLGLASPNPNPSHSPSPSPNLPCEGVGAARQCRTPPGPGEGAAEGEGLGLGLGLGLECRTPPPHAARFPRRSRSAGACVPAAQRAPRGEEALSQLPSQAHPAAPPPGSRTAPEAAQRAAC